jgi:hypothetical protein
LFAILVLAPQTTASEEAGGNSDLEAAITTLRKVDTELLKDPNRSKRTEDEMEAAWEKMEAATEVIHKAGARGMDRIKQELKKLDDAKEKDDFFRLSAAALLYAAGGPSEAKSVAAIWDTTPLDLYYNSVFFPACRASATRDSRVLPMLTACLRDRKASAFVADHFLTIPWPQTQFFIWGTYGPKGLPTLHETLLGTKNSVARQSAMMVLAVSQYLPALETIRAMAAEPDSEVRAVALEALGHYGHPQDFRRLTNGLKDSDEIVLEYALAGAIAYGDLRAADLIIPLLRHPEEKMRCLALEALLRLPTSDGWRATIQTTENLRGGEELTRFGEELTRFRRRLEIILGKHQLTPDEFLLKNETDRQAVVRKVVKAQQEEDTLKADDRKLTHEDLLKAAADWMRRGRITGGDYVWVESRHVLAAATDKDIDLLLDVRGRVMQRISDECLDEISILEDLIHRLGRSRYRQEVGVTEKAEEPVKPPDAPGVPRKSRDATPLR